MSWDDDRARARAGSSLRRVLGALLIAMIAFAPLAVGTVHEWSRGTVFAAAALAWLAAILQRLRTGKGVDLTVPFAALSVAVVATALQLVPLPPAILRLVSPAADELLSLRGYDAHPVSLEPAATVAELAKLGAYLAFFAAAAVATAVAVIGLVQAAFGVKLILGVYKPDAEWAPLVRGTFVNPNHFGALMCLGGACALLLALRDRGLRPYAFAATFIIAMAVVLTVERASVIAALLRNVVVFAIDWVQLRRGSEALRPRVMLRVLLALAVVAGVGVAVGFGARRLEPEVDKTVRLHDLEDPLSK